MYVYIQIQELAYYYYLRYVSFSNLPVSKLGVSRMKGKEDAKMFILVLIAHTLL